MNFVGDYYVAQRAHCLNYYAATVTACNTAGFQKLEALGKAMAIDDYYTVKTAYERTKWRNTRK